MRFLPVALMLVAGTPTRAPAAQPARPSTPPAKTAHAYLALGCFWSAEVAFEGVPGVRSVTSGYTGGAEKNPTYEQVSSGATGHFEAVDVVYDPARISYGKLLDIFWHSIDPTQGTGQFCDHGRHYRSVIFFADSGQESQARASKRTLEASGVLKQPIATLILPAGTFWPAEDYHQDFWKKKPEHYRSYRTGCGRDRRLAQIWGEEAAKPMVH